MSHPPLHLAILFFGRVYNYDKSYQSILDSFVGENNADFFLSHSPLLQENKELEEFEKLYKPKKIINDPINIDIPGLPQNQIRIPNKVSMFTNKKRAFDAMMEYAKETNTTYDYIISARVDCYYETVLEYEQIVKDSKLTPEELEKTVFLPIKFNYLGVNDQVAFGRFRPMQIYSSLIDDIVSIFKLNPDSDPERNMRFHLETQKIHVVYFDLEYYIVR
jgi:hypothetical protein